LRKDAVVSEHVASLEELRAEARRRGVEADDAELKGVRQFLSVFLPAVDELSALLPPDAPGPSPLEAE
jgi:hypothetical protein